MKKKLQYAMPRVPLHNLKPGTEKSRERSSYQDITNVRTMATLIAKKRGQIAAPSRCDLEFGTSARPGSTVPGSVTRSARTCLNNAAQTSKSDTTTGLEMATKPHRNGDETDLETRRQPTKSPVYNIDRFGFSATERTQLRSLERRLGRSSRGRRLRFAVVESDDDGDASSDTDENDSDSGATSVDTVSTQL